MPFVAKNMQFIEKTFFSVSWYAMITTTKANKETQRRNKMSFEKHWLAQLEEDLKRLKEDNRKAEKELANKIKQFKKENKGFL